MREEQGALRSSSSRDTPDARACLSLSNAFCPRRDVALLHAPVLVIFPTQRKRALLRTLRFFSDQPRFLLESCSVVYGRVEFVLPSSVCLSAPAVFIPDARKV